MPDSDAPSLTDLGANFGNFSGCCPVFDGQFTTYGVQPLPPGPQAPSFPTNGSTDRLEPVPMFLSDPTWRAKAVADRAKFPAGYTYFAQLVGHDIGNSVALHRVPYSFTGTEQQAIDEGRDPMRYNLIENALTLETVYGHGPTIATHIYHPKTLKFDIGLENNITRPLIVHRSDPEMLEHRYAIHDNRNRDTTMLHRMTASLMKYHNKIVDEIAPDEAALRVAPFAQKLEIYARARSHMIDVWHGLIRNDLMQVMLMDTGVSLEEVDAEDRLDDTTLLHGVFRVFHALPLRGYTFANQSFSLGAVLASNTLSDEETRAGWPINWENFFDQTSAANKTGFSASITAELSSGILNLPKLDALSATSTKPLRLDDPRIDVFKRLLPPAVQDQLTPERLAQDFKAKHDIDIAPKTLGNGALFVALMVEAHLHGPDGKLGPLGSLLLALALEARMKAVKKMALPNGLNLSVPTSMLELIQAVPKI